MSSAKKQKLMEAMMGEVRRFIAGAILFNLKVAGEVGLNGTDMQCLNLLQLQGAAKPGEFARWASLTTGGVTVVLDRLEKAGFIRREPNPQDRRSTIIRPVLAQYRKFEPHYRAKGEALIRALAHYPEDDLKVILDFFQRVNSPQAGTE